MPAKGMDAVFQELRRAVLLREGAAIADDQLLESFVANNDTAAFEVLVRRHGRMVQGVCYRVLQNIHDAEDAYQATFLVLAQKAGKVIPRAHVGNWLHGVANTTALRARSVAARRRSRERQVLDMPERISQEHATWNDLIPLLDQELLKLPEKYRLAIVLCDLEGRSRKNVAKQLKIPEGTLSSRLTTARQMLAKRLSRRGLAVTGGTVASLIGQNVASACVRPTLVASTVKAASLLAAGQAASTLVSASVFALTEGVLKIMLIHKLKALAAVVMMMGVFGYGGALVSQRTGAAQSEVGEKGAGAAPAQSAAAKPKETEDKTVDDGLRPVPAAPNPKERIDEKPSKPAKEDLSFKPLEKQRAEHQRQMNNALLNAEVAYWNLYGAYGTLYSVDETLHVMDKLGQGIQSKGQIKGDILEQIKGQHEEYLGERANALAAVLEAEHNLRKILGVPMDDGMRLVPVSEPGFGHAVSTQWEQTEKAALMRRPEMTLAREDLRFRQLQLHQLNQADEKKALAAKRSAGLQLAQAEAVLKDQEDRVKRTLASQYKSLDKWCKLVEDRRAERRAWGESLAKKFKNVELDKQPIDLDLLDVLRRLSLARTKEYQAVAEYMNAMARTDFANGTMHLQNIVLIGENAVNPGIQVPNDGYERAETLILRRRPEMFSQPGIMKAVDYRPTLLGEVGVPGVTEFSPRSKYYLFEITLLESDPASGDFGEKSKVSYRTQMVLAERQTGLANTGQNVPFLKSEVDRPKALPAGYLVQLTATPRTDGLLQLEIAMELTEANRTDEMITQVAGTVIRSVSLVRIGETILLVERNDKNQARYGVRIKATEFTDEVRQKMNEIQKIKGAP